jgi:hypothetical protein
VGEEAKPEQVIYFFIFFICKHPTSGKILPQKYKVIRTSIELFCISQMFFVDFSSQFRCITLPTSINNCFFSLVFQQVVQVNGEVDKKDDSGNETGAGEHEQEDDENCYDKTKSFFDNISCEAVERSKGM